MNSEIPAGWEETTLDKFVALQRGYDLPAQHRRPGRVPVMGSAGVSGYHDTARCDGPGVVVGRSGASIGRVHYCDENYWPLNTALFVKDFLGNHRLYAFHLLKTLDLGSFNSGSAQPSLNRNYIASIKVRVPAPPEQRAIASVLGALDEKIESNRKVAEKAWGVAGEVFGGLFGGDWAARRFAGRPAPPSGSWGELRELLTLHYGKALRADVRRDGATLVVGSSGVVGTHDQSLVAGPVVVVGRKGTAGSVVWVGADAWPIDTTFYAEPAEGLTPEFVYFALTACDLPALTADSAVPGLNRDAAYLRPVVVPTPPAVAEFQSAASPLLRLAQQMEAEAQMLAAIRDDLLPKLVSGRLRVSDVADDVEGAVAA